MLTRLRVELMSAMRSKDVVSKLIIQGIISAADEARIAIRRDLTDDEVIRVINKENKKYHQALDGAIKAKRDDLISDANTKITVIEKLLSNLTY